VEIIKQKIYPVDRDKKQALLAHLITEFSWFQVLVFTRTKHGANKLVEQLVKAGIGSMAIHGNKSQAARTRALAEFKTGELQVLVATDIAARGIDIDQLPYVVNYDLPNVPEDYVHRIGRTGRAGATGEAISLVCVDEHEMLRDIEKLIKQTLPKTVIAGFEPDPNARAQPIQLRSNDHMNGGFGGSRNGGRNPGRGGNRSSGDRGGEGGQRPAARGESKPRSATGGANAGTARTSAAGTGGNGNTARPARSASAPRTGARGAATGNGPSGPSHRSGGRGR
jgi:ATP-dependent RNA helicase RhlE